MLNKSSTFEPYLLAKRYATSSSIPKPLAASTFCLTKWSKFLLPPTSPPEIFNSLVAHGLNVKPYSFFRRLANKSTISNAI